MAELSGPSYAAAAPGFDLHESALTLAGSYARLTPPVHAGGDDSQDVARSEVRARYTRDAALRRTRAIVAGVAAAAVGLSGALARPTMLIATMTRPSSMQLA
jgi:hypothetical protein